MSFVDWLRSLFGKTAAVAAPSPPPAPTGPSPSPRFEKGLTSVFHFEGGLVDDKADPGGITNFGISLKWLKSVDETTTADTIRNLTKEQARALYHQHFWLPAYNQLGDDDVANYVFDMTVNMGPAQAHKIAQQAGGVPEIDGKLGTGSISILNLQDQPSLLGKMRALRVAFYQDLAQRKPAEAKFLANWLRRANSAPWAPPAVA